MFFRNTDGRQHARRVTRMDAGQLDVLHDSRDESIRAVGDGIGFHFDGVFQKLINQDRPLRRDIRRPDDIVS